MTRCIYIEEDPKACFNCPYPDCYLDNYKKDKIAAAVALNRHSDRFFNTITEETGASWICGSANMSTVRMVMADE